jgi:hypothetical protein
MANLEKIREIFEKYSISSSQINNTGLNLIAKEIEPYMSNEEYLAVDEMLDKYNSQDSIQINNQSLFLIYNNLEEKILLLDENISLEDYRK